MVEKGFRVICGTCANVKEVIPCNNKLNLHRELRHSGWIPYHNDWYCSGECVGVRVAYDYMNGRSLV